MKCPSSSSSPPSSRGDWDTQIYVAALPPFVLGIPERQVQLFLSEIHLGLPNVFWEKERVIANILNHEHCRVLPETYHEYFTSVYSRAVLGREGLPPCSLRFISGQGYGTSNIKDTHVKCGKRKELLRFANMGDSATVLTILDICSNPHVAACLADKIPPSWQELQQWNKTKVFDDLPFSLACSKSTLSWRCRVGWDGQHSCSSDHPDSKPDELDPKFTELLCFPVTNCILAAIKMRYCEGDSHSLDQIFRDKFLQLQTRYLKKKDFDVPPPPTYSNLTRLQTLLDNGVLRINPESFDCILYQRQREWFPTRELAVVLAVDQADGKLAEQQIVKFVIETITAWYREDPQERYWKKVFEIPYIHREEQNAWRNLIHMVGNLRFELLDCYFFISNTTIAPCEIDEGESNVALKDLALYFPHFMNLVETVQNWIEMGNAESSLESSRTDDDCVPRPVSTGRTPTE